MNNEWNNPGGENNNGAENNGSNYNGNNGYDNEYYNNSGYNNSENQNNNGQYGANNGQYARGSQEYAYQTVMNNGRPKTLGWSLASMITGILSVVCCCFGWTGLIFGIAAVVLAVVSRRNLGYFDGMSIAGLILGIFGIVFGVAMIVMLFVETEFLESFIEEYNKAFEDMYGSEAGGTNNDF